MNGNELKIKLALEKQVPKPPIYYGNETCAKCRMCGRVVHFNDRYCCKCGNALDWRRKEETNALQGNESD